MKNILVLGAGKSAPFLIANLLDEARENDWFVTVGDMDHELARRRVAGHPRGSAIHFDVNDAALRDAQIRRADVVVNMLSPRFQSLIAWDCVSHGCHMVSASYRSAEVRDLDRDAARKNILILCEMGLDPGIDHMSAMALIDGIRERQGVIRGFVSYGSGLPAPGTPSEPLRYVITWNPRNVVMAGEAGAQYLEDGKIKLIPHHEVFHHTWNVDVDGIGTLEAYPNRDSLSYMAVFGLDDVATMIRGTLRWPGWSETWAQIVKLGLPNETLRVPNLTDRSYREVVEMFLPMIVTGADVEERLARFLGISPTGKIMENLRWLGLFSDEKVRTTGDTAAAMMTDLLSHKLAMPPGGRDMVIIQHKLDVEYPADDGRSERIVSTMVEFGEPDGFTAMARTVGLPVALVTRLLLTDRLPLTGCHIPTHPSIYEPVLRELAGYGISFTERTLAG